MERKEVISQFQMLIIYLLNITALLCLFLSAPIDIQSILNGAAKFCRHCDVVILNNLIRKRVSDLPFLYKEPDLLCDGDELYFCSSACYMQFALMHRTPSMTQDKVYFHILYTSLKYFTVSFLYKYCFTCIN